MLYVVFTTRNGAQTLPGLLDSFKDIVPPEGGYRLVAVDNASNDASRAILDKYAGRLPLTVLSEPVPGKNNALNRALDWLGARAGDAELIVFTDDDVLPDRDWLAGLQAAARQHPAVDLFGGRIDPAWPCVVPAWIHEFEDLFGVLFAATASPTGPCAPNEIWGPNMAIRGRVFVNGIRFNPRFGPDGTMTYAMGSETELTRRLFHAGHRTFFVETARVRHRVRPSQLSEDWVMGRAFRAGYGFALGGYLRRHRFYLGGVPVRIRLSNMKARFLRHLVKLTGSDPWRRRVQFSCAWHEGAIMGGRMRRERDLAAGANPRYTAVVGCTAASLGGFVG